MLRLPNKKSEDGHLFGWKGGYFDITSLELPEVMFLSGEVSRCLLITVQGCVYVFVLYVQSESNIDGGKVVLDFQGKRHSH